MDLWIIDRDTGLQTEVIDTYTSAKWGRRMWGPASFEVLMETHDFAGLDVAVGRHLWVQDRHEEHSGGHLYLIEQVEVDTAADSPPVKIAGRDLGVYLNWRGILPPIGDSHERITDAAETAMKHYVDLHVVDPVLAERALARFTIADDEGRGPEVVGAARFQWVGDYVDGLGMPVGIGWEISWDRETNEYVFDVVVGEDRTATVFVDPEFETAQEIRWLQSIATHPTFAYVAGQGEGELRTIVERYTGVTEPEGYDRREVILDARDLADEAELEQRGDEALAETSETEAFQIKMAEFGSFRYPDDFDMGDIISIRSAEFALSAAAQVVGVTSSVGSGEGGAVTTTIEVGHVWPTLPRRVRQMIDQPTASGRT